MKTYDWMMLYVELFIAAFLIGAGGTLLVFSIGHLMTSARAEEIPAPIHVQTINRAPLMEEHEGLGIFRAQAPQPPMVLAPNAPVPLEERIVNLVEKTGFYDLPMKKQIEVVRLTGLITEETGKLLATTRRPGCVVIGTLGRHLGVNLQIMAMNRNGELSSNPLLAAAQGFLVGL